MVTEQTLRRDLAALYRLADMHGWSDLIYTHITAEIPGTGEYLINSYGTLFSEVTASSLVKVELMNMNYTGRLDLNPAAAVIHTAVHRARPDARFVMHTHSKAGIAVSASTQKLELLSQQASFVVPHLRYHDYQGVVCDPAEQQALVESLGTSDFLMLRHHGLLTCGNTAADVFLNMYTLDEACRIQVMTPYPHNPITADVRDVHRTQETQSHGIGAMYLWPAMLRRLERECPDYKD